MPSQIVFPSREVIHPLFSLPIESLLCIWQDNSTDSCQVVSLCSDAQMHEDLHYAVLLEHEELKSHSGSTTMETH